jgi:hypothetical protein
LQSKSYTATIQVAQPAEVVFNHISEITKWWSTDFEGSSKTLNDEFIICHPGRHYSKQKLIEVVAGKKIVWLVTDSNLPWLEKDTHEWTNTKMIFEISTAGNKTTLHFTHEGLVAEKECYAMCQAGWNMVIKERLFNLITGGTAM